MYYLTGYDTSGYSMFQAGYLGADGRTALITRTADRLQSKMTSIFDEVRIWYDREDASPADELRNMLDDHGCRGKRLGIEYHAYGFTGLRAKMVDAALEGFCELIEATDLVREVRMVKSAAELEYVRRAGQLCDQILEVSIQRTAPGVSVKRGGGGGGGGGGVRPLAHRRRNCCRAGSGCVRACGSLPALSCRDDVQHCHRQGVGQAEVHERGRR